MPVPAGRHASPGEAGKEETDPCVPGGLPPSHLPVREASPLPAVCLPSTRNLTAGPRTKQTFDNSTHSLSLPLTSSGPGFQGDRASNSSPKREHFWVKPGAINNHAATGDCAGQPGARPAQGPARRADGPSAPGGALRVVHFSAEWELGGAGPQNGRAGNAVYVEKKTSVPLGSMAA